MNETTGILGTDAAGRAIRVGTRLRHPRHGSGWRVSSDRPALDDYGIVVMVRRMIMGEDGVIRKVGLGVAIPEDVNEGGWRVMIGRPPRLHHGPR